MAPINRPSTYYTTSYYTLCDGHPRVITSIPTATSTTTLPPSTTTILAEGVGWATYLEPNCTVSFDDCSGLWSRYASASSVYQSVSFDKAHTTVQLGSGASWWVVNGATTTFPTPLPFTISLGDEYIHRSPPGSNYIIVTTPPPGGLIIDDGYHMTAGGPPVTIEHTIDFVNTPYTPHCRTEKPTCTANQRCQISGDRVEIFWFPPQTNVTRDMCATAPPGNGITSRPPTNFTWTPITTGPYTVLPGNTTWYSGNVYVSLNRIGAHCTWSEVPVGVGGDHGGEILTMAPSELFSQRATRILTTNRPGLVDFEPYAYSFNFDDLISPYPWSAWKGTPDCAASSCSVINGSYNPWIAVPEAIRRLDPAWATCDLALYGLYDPPRALSTVGNIFATLTSQDPRPQPTPGQSLPQSQVEPTNVPPQPSKQPDPPNDPSDPSDPSNPGQPPNNPPPQNNPPANNPPQNNPPANNPPQNNPPANNPPQNNPPQNNNPPRPGVTPPPTPTTIGTVGGQPVVINPTNPGNVVVGGTRTLTPGAPGITVPGGTSISMADPSHVVISAPGAPAPSTLVVPPAGIPAAPTTIGSVGGAPVVVNPADPNHVIVGGTQTLAPGGPGVIIGGTSMSMIDPGHIVISTPGAAAPSTMAIPLPNAATPTAGVVITLPNGELVTATAVPGSGGSSVMVSGTMFSVGGAPITLPNGVILSEAPSGTGIVVIDPATGATSTIPFSSVSGLGGPVTTPHATPGAVVTIGGHEYTVINQGGSMIIPELGITLTHGGPASTVNGTVISDAGTGIVVGTTTEGFSTVTVSDDPPTEDATGAAMRVKAFGGAWWKEWWALGWLGLMIGLGGIVVL